MMVWLQYAFSLVCIACLTSYLKIFALMPPGVLVNNERDENGGSKEGAVRFKSQSWNDVGC